MSSRKLLNVLLLVSMLASLLLMGGGIPASAQKAPSPLATRNSNVAAMPAGPTDQTRVPHYFGPYPNWALSPSTSPDVTVNITGDGAGATAVASVGVNGAITGISLTAPGTGYTFADVNITSANGNGATATASVTPSGVVTGVTVDLPGAGYTSPTVSISGGGGTGTLVQVGNPLMVRQYATDYATAPGTLGPVLVVVPTAMPSAGLVQSIQYFNQATTGGSPNPSAGNLFHAYVLHATGVANEYTVLWDSGELTEARS